MIDAKYYAQLIASDAEFGTTARKLDPESLRVEIKYAVAGLAAAEYRHSPAGTPLPGLETVTNVVTEILLKTLTSTANR